MSDDNIIEFPSEEESGEDVCHCFDHLTALDAGIINELMGSVKEAWNKANEEQDPERWMAVIFTIIGMQQAALILTRNEEVSGYLDGVINTAKEAHDAAVIARVQE